MHRLTHARTRARDTHNNYNSIIVTMLIIFRLDNNVNFTSVIVIMFFFNFVTNEMINVNLIMK